MKNKEILEKIRRILFCLTTHPDNELNSEFADRIDDLIDIRDELYKRLAKTKG